MATSPLSVESPARARTLGKHLGPGYIVRASLGHVRDLPRRTLGADSANAFAPTYETRREAASQPYPNRERPPQGPAHSGPDLAEARSVRAEVRDSVG
jgi:hypothetical protein